MAAIYLVQILALETCSSAGASVIKWNVYNKAWQQTKNPYTRFHECKSLLPFVKRKVMMFSRSFRGQVQIIIFLLMFSNMSRTVHI